MALIYVPIALILLLLGMFYVVSITREHHQEVFLDRLADTAYLVIPARQALVTDDPSLVQGDLERYRDLYGVRSAVVDTSGRTVAASGLDVSALPQRSAALAGRRAAIEENVWPWDTSDIVVAEPVLDGGDVVGALLTSSDTAQVRRGIWYSWSILIAGGMVMALLALLLADRTAGWVLRPVRAVDRAMEQMGSGRLDERIPASTGPPELRQVVERFNEMAEKVERLMHRQQEFVANASHELRNPLNALMLRIEALALTVPEDSAPEVEHVRAEAVRMAQILDALLLLAEDSNLGAVQPLDVAELVARRADGWRLLDREHEVVLDLPADILWGAADPTALGTAMDTIVDNALKFSPPGTTVDVAVREAGRFIEITVRDHGPGVPTDQLDRLTERFWRSPGHSAVRGSGLGLAISSELLASAGGSLRLELPGDGGLRAHLTVPTWEATS